jgi:alkylated DNA nucleotide flippase Atl1
MNVVKDKYRGTQYYVRALAELVRAAEYCGVTTYQDIAVIMGLPLRGSHMGKEVGHILGEIAEDEVQSGRPMLSAVVVGVNGKPGPGLFSLARDIGRLTSEAEPEFWEAERLAAYKVWRRPLSK